MRRSALKRNALYLIRPDGYIALAEANGAPEQLERYFKERDIRRDQMMASMQ